MKRKAIFVLLVCSSLRGADPGRIVRPADRSVLPAGPVDIVATAPGGRLELDGRPIDAMQPFPNVLHAKTTVPNGEHKLVLIWEGGQAVTRFFSGVNAPEAFAPFRQHPPQQNVDCTQCHQLTKRGRFSFKGGNACFDCHRTEGFVKVHTHTADVLTECGLCHNAHGSTVKAHLIHTKEVACKQCHN